LGAVIELEADNGKSLGRHVLDGGRGKNGQNSGQVLMGLGSYTGLVHYRIFLPNVVIGNGNALAGSVVNVVPMTTTLSIEDTMVSCSIVVQPYTGLLEWHFKWRTNRWSPSENDVVHLSGTGCSFASIDLSHSSANTEVTVNYQADATTGERWYEHEVIWVDQQCQVRCNYSFSAESASADSPQIKLSSSPVSGRIKVCPQSL